MRNLILNWRTTSAGLGMIIGSVVHLVFNVKAGTANENTWTIALTAIVGGIGLIAAGDAGVTQPAPLTKASDESTTPPKV
jgi:hypothetical protein